MLAREHKEEFLIIHCNVQIAEAHIFIGNRVGLIGVP